MVLKRLVFVVLLATLLVAPSVADAPLVFLLKWGSFGNGPGQFAGPTGITTDVAGNVYITDAGHELVQKFSSTGQFLSAFGGLGFGNGKFRNVADVSVDVNGTLYVTDATNALIQVFSSDGTFLRQWSAVGSFNSALDPTGAFLVTAAGDSARVFRTSDGARFATFAFSNYFRSFEGCLGIGPSGVVYIAPREENVVRRYSLTGVFLGEWGSTGGGAGQFAGTAGLTVDSDENIYVVDVAGGIMKFTGAGQFLSQFGSFGTADGQFFEYRDMAADLSGNIFLLDPGLGRATKFGPMATPASRSSWGQLKTRYR